MEGVDGRDGRKGNQPRQTFLDLKNLVSGFGGRVYEFGLRVLGRDSWEGAQAGHTFLDLNKNGLEFQFSISIFVFSVRG